MNQEFCTRYLKNRNPLGAEFRTMPGPGEPLHIFQIVGVVKNSKYQALRQAFEPIAFVAAAQNKEPSLRQLFVVRSSLPFGTLMPELSRAITSQNAGLSFKFDVLATDVEDSLLRERSDGAPLRFLRLSGGRIGDGRSLRSDLVYGGSPPK